MRGQARAFCHPQELRLRVCRQASVDVLEQRLFNSFSVKTAGRAGWAGRGAGVMKQNNGEAA